MRAAAVAWALLVVSIIVLADTQSLGPVLGVIAMVPAGDKIAHFVLMGGLGAFVSLALGWSGARSPRTAVLVGGGGVLAAVALEELSQGLIAWRTLDAIDFAADTGGIALGSAIAWALLRRRAAGSEGRRSQAEAARSSRTAERVGARV